MFCGKGGTGLDGADISMQTKVFRSKDYNSLLWVLNQLFTKVDATKPPSSRNVSAEIFVVCRGFKAPKRIDPRLLDPRSVFEDLAEPAPNNEAKVYNPEVKKRKREGYEEGDCMRASTPDGNLTVLTSVQTHSSRRSPLASSSKRRIQLPSSVSTIGSHSTKQGTATLLWPLWTDYRKQPRRFACAAPT